MGHRAYLSFAALLAWPMCLAASAAPPQTQESKPNVTAPEENGVAASLLGAQRNIARPTLSETAAQGRSLIDRFLGPPARPNRADRAKPSTPKQTIASPRSEAEPAEVHDNAGDEVTAAEATLASYTEVFPLPERQIPPDEAKEIVDEYPLGPLRLGGTNATPIAPTDPANLVEPHKRHVPDAPAVHAADDAPEPTIDGEHNLDEAALPFGDEPFGDGSVLPEHAPLAAEPVANRKSLIEAPAPAQPPEALPTTPRRSRSRSDAPPAAPLPPTNESRDTLAEALLSSKLLAARRQRTPSPVISPFAIWSQESSVSDGSLGTGASKGHGDHNARLLGRPSSGEGLLGAQVTGRSARGASVPSVASVIEDDAGNVRLPISFPLVQQAAAAAPENAASATVSDESSFEAALASDWVSVADDGNETAAYQDLEYEGPVAGEEVIATDDGAAVVGDSGAAIVSDGPPVPCDEGLLPGGLRLVDLPSLYVAEGRKHGNLWYAWDAGQTAWAKVQYLSWFTYGDTLPALVTSSPPGTPQDEMGVLGAPDTEILFGFGHVNDGDRNGGRITLGYGQFQGIQGDYYALDEEATRFDISSIGTPILARPFFNVSTDASASSIIAAPVVIEFGFPTNLQGEIHIEETSRVQSAGLSYRRLMWMDTWAPFNGFVRLNLLGGYRWFRLEETLNIVDIVRPMGGVFAPGTVMNRSDYFNTENDFHGGEIGMMAMFQQNRWSLEALARVALGNMHQVTNIDGRSETITPQIAPAPPLVAVSNNGLLAQPSNIGKHTRDQFAVIPEFSIELGFQATRHTKLLAGYNFIYVSQVARPGDQIDIAVNPTQAGGGMLVGPARPESTRSDSDFWMQGFTGGIEWKY